MLKGARRLLTEHKPIIYLEYCPKACEAQTGVAGTPILELLARLGYQATVLHRTEPPQPIAPDGMVETIDRLWQHDWDAGNSHLDIRWHFPQ